MSLRTKFFIIVGVVIAFIIFVVVMLVRGEDNAVVVTPPNVTGAVKASDKKAQPSLKTQPITPSVSNPPAGGPPPAPDFLDISRSFAERFGSFSNQSNFENVEGLKPFMTPAMRTWADNFIRDAAAKMDPSAPYYGITTRTLEVVGKNVQESNATVVAKTQRREVKGNASPRVFYQDLSLTLKKVEGEWKVEKVEWK